jgi:hypothetical protein
LGAQGLSAPSAASARADDIRWRFVEPTVR